MKKVNVRVSENEIVTFRSMRNAIRTLKAKDSEFPIVTDKTFGCGSAYAEKLLNRNGYNIVLEQSTKSESEYRAEQSAKSKAYEETQKDLKEEEEKQEKKDEKQKKQKEVKQDVKNTSNQHHQYDTLLKVISCRLNALLVGPAGSGKTTAAEQVAKHINLPFYAISVGQQTTKFEFFGYMDATGKYIRTLFREAFENGGVFLIDEMDAGNANVIISINSALANGVCAFADGMVEKHPDFVLIASANTFGNGANQMFVGRNQLDGATNDRFVTINWEYDLSLEDRLCENKQWLNEVRRVREIVERNKMRYIVSPRASIYGAKLLKAGLEWEQVKKMVIYKGMNETEKQLVK